MKMKTKNSSITINTSGLSYKELLAKAWRLKRNASSPQSSNGLRILWLCVKSLLCYIVGTLENNLRLQNLYI